MTPEKELPRQDSNLEPTGSKPVALPITLRGILRATTVLGLAFFLAFASIAQERQQPVTITNLQGNWELVEQKPDEGALTLTMMRARNAPADAIKEMESRIASGALAKRRVTLIVAGDTMTVQGRLDDKDGPPTTSRFSVNGNRVSFQAQLPGGLMRIGRNTLLFAADPFPQLGLPAVRYLYRRADAAQVASARGVLSPEERPAFFEQRIAAFAAAEFANHRGQWLIESFRHAGADSYVVTTPDPPSVGFERVLFVLSFAGALPTHAAATYGWQEQRFVLISTGPGVSPNAYPAILSNP
jgi:hypothetical protein